MPEANRPQAFNETALDSNYPQPLETQFIQEPQSFAESKVPFLKRIFKTKKRKIILGSSLFLLLILIAISAIYLSKPKPVPPPQPVTLEFWGTSVNEEVMNGVISDFEKENPLIKVQYTKQIETNYKDRITTRLKISNYRSLPNLVEIDESTLSSVYPYITAISNQSLTNRYAPTTIKNNSVTVPKFDSKTKTYSYSTNLYGFPYKFNSLALAYNKVYLQQYLEQVKLSETEFAKLDWSGIFVKAKDLVRTTKAKDESNRDYDQIIRGGIGLGSSATITNAPEILELLLMQDNVQIYDPSKQNYTIDDRFSKVFDFYTSIAKNGLWSDDLGNDLQAFSNGNLAMALVKSEDIDTIKRLNPNLDFKTILPPKIASVKNISLSKSLIIPQSKPYYEQTITFLEYLSRPDVSLKLFNGQNENTFVPEPVEALRQIPENSPFAIFSDINPTAEMFQTYDYDKTTEVINNYLQSSYAQNFSKVRKGEKLSNFVYNTTELENNLNRIIPTPTPTAIKE